MARISFQGKQPASRSGPAPRLKAGSPTPMKTCGVELCSPSRANPSLSSAGTRCLQYSPACAQERSRLPQEEQTQQARGTGLERGSLSGALQGRRPMDFLSNCLANCRRRTPRSVSKLLAFSQVISWRVVVGRAKGTDRSPKGGKGEGCPKREPLFGSASLAVVSPLGGLPYNDRL